MKTLAQYLSAAGGDHEAAAKAMHADLIATSQERDTLQQTADREANANIRARTIAKAAEPLFEALGIPAPQPGQRPSQDAQAALEEGIQQAIEGIAALEEGIEDWQSIAADAGLDVQAVRDAKTPDEVEALISGFIEGVKATDTERDAATQELNAYRFAAQNGLNPEAVLLQRGIEHLELREVEVTGKDGQKTTQKQWQLPGKQEGEYVPALDHLQPVMAALKPQAQQAQGHAWVTGQESRESVTPGRATTAELVAAKTSDPAYQI